MQFLKASRILTKAISSCLI